MSKLDKVFFFLIAVMLIGGVNASEVSIPVTGLTMVLIAANIMMSKK